VIHEVSEEVQALDAVSSVNEVAWEWRPNEGETASDVHAGSSGAVIELEDGLVGLRGDTGEELWKYRIPDTEGLSVAFSPSGEQAVVAAPDEPAVLLDTATGALVTEDVHWDGEARFLGETRLLHRQGEETETLFRVSDLDSGTTLWEQEAPETCFEEESARLISATHNSEAIVLLLHCSKDTSEDSLRAPDPDTVNALVALSAEDGRELWRYESVDEDGLGSANALMLQDSLVANLPGEEGWLIIDPADGTTLAESPRPVLAVNENDYLVGPEPGGEEPTHELRSFDGDVLTSATLSEDRWPADTSGTVVGLMDHLVTIDMERGSTEDSVNAVTTTWDEEDTESVITATTTKMASNFEPGRLLPVPGAVLVFVPMNHAADIESVEHVTALR